MVRYRLLTKSPLTYLKCLRPGADVAVVVKVYKVGHLERIEHRSSTVQHLLQSEKELLPLKKTFSLYSAKMLFRSPFVALSAVVLSLGTMGKSSFYPLERTSTNIDPSCWIHIREDRQKQLGVACCRPPRRSFPAQP